MKFVAWLLLAFVCLIGILFLAWSFVNWSFNPAYWNVGSRLGYVVLCLIGGLIIPFVYTLYEEDREETKE